MTGPATDRDRLFDEAVDHMIRLQNEPGNPVAIELAQGWRLRSAEHELAWQEAGEIFGMTGKVLDGQRKAEQGPVRLSRRKLIVGGLVVVTAAATAGPELIVQAKADYLTSTAEIRRVVLSDGSAVTLGPESAIAFHVSEEVRRADLLRGMGYFEIAVDAARSFEVGSGPVLSAGAGPSFDVSIDDDFVNVGVDQGRMDVRFAGVENGEVVQLLDGEWARLGGEGRAIVRGARDKAQIAAWRQGLMFADNEPIGAVVAKIARWQPGRTILANPALGRASISGAFDLSNPIAALRAVVHPYGGKVRQISPYLTIISTV